MTRRVIVTGAAGALGRSVIERFLIEGERILAVDVDESALADLTPMAPSHSLAVRRVDLADSGQVVQLFSDVVETSGVPASVVHLVGGFRFGSLADLRDEDWSYLLRINLETTLRVLRECSRRFEQAGGGTLVAVSSPAALVGQAGLGPYAAVKAGVLRLVEALAQEMGRFGGRANAVLPGTMDTPANRSAMPDTDPETWVSTSSVAQVIHFLTTPAASAINGAAVSVPGPTLV